MLLQAYVMLDNTSTAVMRDAVVFEAVARILSAGALRFGQLEGVTAAVFDLLNKHEHLPGPLAGIAAFSAHRNNDNRLVRPQHRHLAPLTGTCRTALVRIVQ